MWDPKYFAHVEGALAFRAQNSTICTLVRLLIRELTKDDDDDVSWENQTTDLKRKMES